MKNKKEPIIFDTTLREGFQTPGGIGASLEERVAIAGHIQNYAHWMELGMPANNVDYDIISAIRDRFLEEKYDVGVAVLLRCTDLDIDRASEVMANYPKSMAHVFVGTSEQHRDTRFKGKLGVEGYEEMIFEYVKKAAERPEFKRVMFSPEDSFRTYMQDLGKRSRNRVFFRFLDAAKRGYEEGNRRVGRKTPIILNLPDTTGGSTVYEFDKVIRAAQKRYGDSVELSVHGHNDSDTSSAQAWDVYQRRDVPWIHTTFSHLGERNGIAPTDLTIKVAAERGWLTDRRIVNPENLALLDHTNRTVMALLGREIPDEHLYRTLVSTAGIHTAIASINPQTYHIRGSEYGSDPILELGPTSGSKQVIDVLAANNIRYDADKMEAFTDQLKAQANKRKAPISETRICYEAQKYFNELSEHRGLIVDRYNVRTNETGHTELYMECRVGNTSFTKTKINGGPVEAAIDLLNEVATENGQKPVALEGYRSRVIPNLGSEYTRWERGGRPKILHGVGKDADLAVSVIFNDNGKLYHGWNRHKATTVAEVGSVINGFQEMFALRYWQKG